LHFFDLIISDKTEDMGRKRNYRIAYRSFWSEFVRASDSCGRVPVPPGGRAGGTLLPESGRRAEEFGGKVVRALPSAGFRPVVAGAERSGKRTPPPGPHLPVSARRNPRRLRRFPSYGALFIPL